MNMDTFLYSQERKEEGSKDLLLISCSKSKLSRPAPSREFYTGQFFQKAVKFAEKNKIDVRILSAKYGLMKLNDIARPYDIKIKYKRNIERLKSTVIPELRTIQKNYNRILVIMGKNYRRVIEPLFCNERYIVLIDPRGIGGYKNIITSLLKVPTIRVWDEILVIKNRLEKNLQKVSLNRFSGDKITVKISSE